MTKIHKITNFNCVVCNENNASIKNYYVPYLNPTNNEWDKFKYVVCKCGHIYLFNRPNSNSLKEIYSPKFNKYYSFDKSIGRISAFFRNIILTNKANSYLKLVKFKKDLKFIEVGCGDGSLIRKVRDILGRKAYLFASDIYLSQNASFKEKKINFIKGKLEDISIKQKFELIICNQVLEHVEDVNKFLVKLNNISSSGTLIVMETPNTNSLDRRFLKEFWGGFHAPQHLDIFDSIRIKKILTKNGFDVIKTEYINATWNWVHGFSNKGLYYDSGLYKFFGNLKNPFVLMFFTMVDILIKFLGGKTSNMRIISRKM